MKKIVEWLSALGGVIVGFFTGLPPLMWILVGVMSMDYITGLACGFAGVSPKTESGRLSSGAAFKGLLKKVLILIVIGLAALIDRAVTEGSGIQIAVVTGATSFWFIASEGLSVLENAAAMGVPIPRILLHALDVMRQQGEPPDESQKKEE